MTSIRQTILDNIGTTLDGIGGVTTVERLIKDWASVSESQRPWIGYMPRKATFVHDSFNSMVVTLPVMVYCHISAATTEARDIALLDIHDAIIAAMMLDPTLDDTSFDVIVVEDESDIGDPDTASANAGGISGTLVIVFNVLYERTTVAQ